MTKEELKSKILHLTREYSRLAHVDNRPGNDAKRVEFEPGQTIPYAGRVFTKDEVDNPPLGIMIVLLSKSLRIVLNI